MCNMNKIKSAILIDDSDIDNFVNTKILENFGATNITVFNNVNKALLFLKKTKIKFQYILVDIYFPLTDGFEFVDIFYELGLDKQQGELRFLSSSINPLDRVKSEIKNIKFIEKPLTIEKLLAN